MSGPFEATGESDLDITRFHGDVAVLTGSTFDAFGDVTLGNTSADDIVIEGTTAFNAPSEFFYEADFWERLEAHDTVIVQGVASSFSALCDVTLGITGDDLDVGADARFGGDVTLEEGFTSEGPATFEDDVTFLDTVAFFDSVAFASDVDCTAGLLVSAGGIEVHGASVFTATTDFNSHVTLGDDGSANIDVGGIMLLHRRMEFTFQGRVPARPKTGPDAGESFDVTDGDVIVSPVLTANRQYTILESGSADGDQFWVVNRSFASFTLTVELPTGLQVALTQATLGGPSVAWFMRVDGIWVTLMLRNA